jgi:hypothetical protein
VNAKFQSDFAINLANKPYCTDELGVTYIRSKKTAIKMRYLQINQPSQVFYLIFDLDYLNSTLAWDDLNLATPNWTATNKLNGHCHAVYRVEAMCVSDFARKAPIKYFAAIESAYRKKLGADIGYASLLTKNPLHEHWQTTVWTEHIYSFDELADYVDIKGHPELKDIEKISGLGRNCQLFEEVSKWAYKAIREYWGVEFHEKWYGAVLSHSEALNVQFKQPLPFSEVKSISKSIANWVARHFTPKGFGNSQASKGRKGGVASGISRKKGSLTEQKPWELEGISRATWYRRRKIK